MIHSSQNKEGVSPVIGVILMVAITVILAAVVGTFVLDLTGNLERNAEASVTFDEDPYSGASDGSLRSQLIAMQNADSVIIEAPDGTELGTMSNVGDTVTVTISDTSDYPNGQVADGDTVTAIGVLDGSRSVLQSYTTSSP